MTGGLVIHIATIVAAYFAGWWIGYRNGKADERRMRDWPYDHRGKL